MTEHKFWHSISHDEVIGHFKTDVISGLTEQQALESKKNFGANELPKERKKPLILLYLAQFNNPIIFILIIG